MTIHWWRLFLHLNFFVNNLQKSGTNTACLKLFPSMVKLFCKWFFKKGSVVQVKMCVYNAKRTLIQNQHLSSVWEKNFKELQSFCQKKKSQWNIVWVKWECFHNLLPYCLHKYFFISIRMWVTFLMFAGASPNTEQNQSPDQEEKEGSHSREKHFKRKSSDHKGGKGKKSKRYMNTW